MGNERVAIRFFTKAEERFSAALQNNPNDIQIFMNRATAYVGLKEYELALGDFNRILELNSVYAPAFEGKAMTYEVMGDVEKSIEMQEAANAIYEELARQGAENIEPNDQPAPNSLSGTWYATNTRHNYLNRITGIKYINANGFGCAPWKANTENAVYFKLPWNTWGRFPQGFKCTGTCNWVNLSQNTQGYNNSGGFSGWTTPAGENYVLLIQEREVCAANWAAIPSYFKVSASYN